MVGLTVLATVGLGRAAQDDAQTAAEQRSLVQAARDTLDRIDGTDDSADRRTMLEEVNGKIEMLRAADPGSPWLAYLRGRALALVGRSGDAVEQLQRFVDTREGRSEWQAYRLLGDLLVREFPRLARSNYRKAEALKDNDPRTTFGLSVCAAKLGAIEEATDLAARAVSLDRRQTVEYLAHLAALLRRAGRYDDALREADSALELARAEAVRAPTPATIRSVYDHYSLLIDVLDERITNTDPPVGDDYLRLAGLMMERGEVSKALSRQEAIRSLAAGIERLSPDVPPSTMERYGTLLAEAGRVDDAIVAFERLLVDEPDNPTALEALATLKASQRTSP